MTTDRQKIFKHQLEIFQRRLFYEEIYDEKQIEKALRDLIDLSNEKRTIKIMAAMLIRESNIQNFAGLEAPREEKINKLLLKL